MKNKAERKNEITITLFGIKLIRSGRRKSERQRQREKERKEGVQGVQFSMAISGLSVSVKY